MKPSVVSQKKIFWWGLLEAKDLETWQARWFNGLMIFLIVSSVVAAVFSTVQNLPRGLVLALNYYELFCLSVFAFEYAARLWSCTARADMQGKSSLKARFSYALSPLGLVDLVAFLPALIAAVFVPSNIHFLLALRFLRLFMLVHYFHGFRGLFHALLEESRNIFIAFLALGFTVLFAAGGVFFAENDAQPEVFSSIPHTLWWAVVTLTTVGYGDMVPITGLGRLFAGVVTVIGVAVVALPSAIIISAFVRYIDTRQAQFCSAIHEKGSALVAKDKQLLDRLRKKHFLSKKTAQRLLSSIEAGDTNGSSKLQVCPHCGKHMKA